MKSNQEQDNIQPTVSYEKENQLLRELYLQRMKLRQKQNKQQMIQIEQHQNSIKPQLKQINQISIKSQINNNNQNKQEKGCNILLNTLFFDTRQKKPDSFIKIFSLLNQDVHKPKKTVSQNLQTIFITTFGFELETFEHLLTMSNAKLILLNDSDEKGQNKIIKQYGGFKNFTVILQAKKQSQIYGVSHTKLWLIKFKTFLRVVVCTSNQHTMDWAVWQNAFWYQDFPLKSNNQTINNQAQNSNKSQFNFNKDFQNTLNQVLEAMIPRKQLQQLTTIKIQNYLFQNVKIILIPSIPGRHVGKNMKRQGICKIKQIMKIFNKISKPILTYNSTSLGIIQSKFIEELYVNFCPKQLFNAERFRLIYPTKRYIQQQTGGQAQVLFLTSQNYRKSDLGKKIMYKYDTNPQNPILGNIPHLKTLLIQPSKKSQQQQEKGILYMGSHNMTKAAWGKLQKQGTQLYISNSELGVIFLDVDLNWYRKWSPFKHPPEPYQEKDQPFLRDHFK